MGFVQHLQDHLIEGYSEGRIGYPVLGAVEEALRSLPGGPVVAVDVGHRLRARQLLLGAGQIYLEILAQVAEDVAVHVFQLVSLVLAVDLRHGVVPVFVVQGHVPVRCHFPNNS